MTKEGISDPNLKKWEEEGRLTIIDIADMLGISPKSYTDDPLTLIPALQNYVSRLPLSQFEQSDWVTLQTDLMSYVADFLIQRHGAQWAVAEDSTTVRGYRYVIEATGHDGEARRIDPTDVVQEEFKKLPIEITRMLASAELTLKLTHHVNGIE